MRVYGVSNANQTDSFREITLPWYDHIVDVELERMLTLARAKAAINTNSTLASALSMMFGSVDSAAEIMNNFLRAYAGLDVPQKQLAMAGPGPLKIHRLRRLALREVCRQHPEVTRADAIAKIDWITDEQICKVIAEQHLKDTGQARDDGDAESWLTKVWHYILDHLPQIIFGILGLILVL